MITRIHIRSCVLGVLCSYAFLNSQFETPSPPAPAPYIEDGLNTPGPDSSEVPSALSGSASDTCPLAPTGDDVGYAADVRNMAKMHKVFGQLYSPSVEYACNYIIPQWATSPTPSGATFVIQGESDIFTKYKVPKPTFFMGDFKMTAASEASCVSKRVEYECEGSADNYTCTGTQLSAPQLLDSDVAVGGGPRAERFQEYMFKQVDLTDYVNPERPEKQTRLYDVSKILDAMDMRTNIVKRDIQVHIVTNGTDLSSTQPATGTHSETFFTFDEEKSAAQKGLGISLGVQGRLGKETLGASVKYLNKKVRQHWSLGRKKNVMTSLTTTRAVATLSSSVATPLLSDPDSYTDDFLTDFEELPPIPEDMRQRLTLNGDSVQLRNLLSPYATFVAKYGTHVVEKMTFGFRKVAIYEVESDSSTRANSKEMSACAELVARMGAEINKTRIDSVTLKSHLEKAAAELDSKIEAAKQLAAKYETAINATGGRIVDPADLLSNSDAISDQPTPLYPAVNCSGIDMTANVVNVNKRRECHLLGGLYSVALSAASVPRIDKWRPRVENNNDQNLADVNDSVADVASSALKELGGLQTELSLCYSKLSSFAETRISNNVLSHQLMTGSETPISTKDEELIAVQFKPVAEMARLACAMQPGANSVHCGSVGSTLEHYVALRLGGQGCNHIGGSGRAGDYRIHVRVDSPQLACLPLVSNHTFPEGGYDHGVGVAVAHVLESDVGCLSESNPVPEGSSRFTVHGKNFDGVGTGTCLGKYRCRTNAFGVWTTCKNNENVEEHGTNLRIHPYINPLTRFPNKQMIQDRSTFGFIHCDGDPDSLHNDRCARTLCRIHGRSHRAFGPYGRMFVDALSQDYMYRNFDHHGYPMAETVFLTETDAYEALQPLMELDV